MSLIVHNAYRYPLSKQREVHDVLMANCTKIITNTVNAVVPRMVSKLGSTPREKWIDVLNDQMITALPKGLRKRVTKFSEKYSTERFVRTYLMEYHRYSSVYPSQYPIVDTVTSWAYTWDTEYGYVVLFLALGVTPEAMTEGLDDVLEPYSYDGRVLETTHPTETPEQVAEKWEELVGESSLGMVGATAQLDGLYERHVVFGLA